MTFLAFYCYVFGYHSAQVWLAHLKQHKSSGTVVSDEGFYNSEELAELFPCCFKTFIFPLLKV